MATVSVRAFPLQREDGVFRSDVGGISFRIFASTSNARDPRRHPVLPGRILLTSVSSIKPA